MISSLSAVQNTFEELELFFDWKERIEKIFEKETKRLGFGFSFRKFGESKFLKTINSKCDACINETKRLTSEDSKQNIFVKNHQEQISHKFNNECSSIHTIDNNYDISNEKLISTSIIKCHNVEIMSLPIELMHSLGHDINVLSPMSHKYKELSQHTSIIGHLWNRKLLSNEMIFLEMGSGRGDLSLAISQCLKELNAFTHEFPNQKSNENANSNDTIKNQVTVNDVNTNDPFNHDNDTDRQLFNIENKQSTSKRKGKQDFNKRKIRKVDYPNDDTSDISIQFILLDRQIHRKKKDNNIRLNHPRLHSYNITDSILVKRYKLDIRDYDISKEESFYQRPFVCISKHFCGSATDLLLKQVESSLYNPQTTYSNSYLNQQKEKTNSLKKNFQGYFICLCCHHQCSWEDYIHQSYFINLRLSQLDFSRMKWLSSWGVTQFRNEEHPMNSMKQKIKEIESVEVENHSTKYDWFTKLSIQEKIELGFQCKRIIDYGRIDFLRNHGYSCEFVQYVKENVTPECYLLRATPK